MATIKFLNGETQEIDPIKAMRIKLIQCGKRQGTPEQIEYIERIESIIFHKVPREYSRSIKRRREPVEQGRLPYKDD